MKNKHTQTINTYLKALDETLNRFPIDDLEAILEVLENAKEQFQTVFICGNGGSWATAAHMVCDFSKNTRMEGSKRLRVIGLGDNISTLTAYANDEGYDKVFAEPVLSLLRPGDVLIALSASGNSPNVLRAVEAAKSLGGITIGLTGFHGGELKDLVDHVLIIPSDSIEMVEDFHLIIDHLITICLSQ